MALNNINITETSYHVIVHARFVMRGATSKRGLATTYNNIHSSLSQNWDV